MEWHPIETFPNEIPSDGCVIIWGKTDNTVDGPNYANIEGWDDERAYILAYQYEDEKLPLGRRFVTTEKDGWGDTNLECWPTKWALLSRPS